MTGREKVREQSENMILIDGEGAVLGRMATFIAKKALMGNRVVIVNCDKVVVTGTQKALQEVYLNKRQRGGTSQKGPYFSKMPDKIVRRTVRGMLPWERTTGKEAFHRIWCHVGVPEEYSKMEKMSFKKKITTPHMTLGELSIYI